ncbi:hypothetical protein HOM50_00045 [bacterium]|jgi:hypothetical protein|nr:hypothetical protein [bacterium]MBT5014787.1 hypothetical protein [bacterium]
MKYLSKMLFGFSLVLLSGCVMQKDSADQSIQLDARQVYDNSRFEYERELVLFRELNETKDPVAAQTIEKKIKDEVLLKNEQYNEEHKQQWFGKRWVHSNSYENFPFIQYKKHLDLYIKKLDSVRDKMYWKSEGVGYLISQLVKELESVRRYIVTNPNYQREHRMIEQQKLQAKVVQNEKILKKANKSHKADSKK